MKIRDERRADRSAVRQIVVAAFVQEMEADLVDTLRDSGDGVISLVAEEAGCVIGHLLLSKLRAPEGCLALAPLSVAPEHQRQGVGSRLLREGLRRAGLAGWRAAFLLGEPTYYGRFGFTSAAAAGFESVYPSAYFQVAELTPGALDDLAVGPVVYPPPFDALSD